MPVMNGLDAATLIKDELPDTKILMVSQWDSAVMKRQAFALGASGYVTKANANLTCTLPFGSP
jgi:DNA-binding NarL/FixJ family response regulator